MGRASIKENKNVYQLKREELGLSREKASELLECEMCIRDRLDPLAKKKFIDTVLELNRDFGITIICVEHNLADIYSKAVSYTHL